MKYVITKQIAVDAESPEDAVAKINTGKTISFNVNERPEPQQSQPQPSFGKPIVGTPVLTPAPANP